MNKFVSSLQPSEVASPCAGQYPRQGGFLGYEMIKTTDGSGNITWSTSGVRIETPEFYDGYLEELELGYYNVTASSMANNQPGTYPIDHSIDLGLTNVGSFNILLISTTHSAEMIYLNSAFGDSVPDSFSTISMPAVASQTIELTEGIWDVMLVVPYHCNAFATGLQSDGFSGHMGVLLAPPVGWSLIAAKASPSLLNGCITLTGGGATISAITYDASGAYTGLTDGCGNNISDPSIGGYNTFTDYTGLGDDFPSFQAAITVPVGNRTKVAFSANEYLPDYWVMFCRADICMPPCCFMQPA